MTDAEEWWDGMSAEQRNTMWCNYHEWLRASSIVPFSPWAFEMLSAAQGREGDLFGDAAQRVSRAASQGSNLGETARWNNVVDVLRELHSSVCRKGSPQPMPASEQQTPDPAFAGSLWTHVKSSKLCVVVGECQMEATNEPGVLYRELNDPSGKLWARAKAEFLDGRYERFHRGEIA